MGVRKMKAFDLFSKRQKLLRGEFPDVYVYNAIPEPLRVQIVHILRDAIGTNMDWVSPVREVYKFVYNTLCREYGVFQLREGSRHEDYKEALFNFLLTCEEVDRVLDVVELAFRVVDRVVRDDHRFRSYTSLAPDDAIKELNLRFGEHTVGYQYESGQIVRVDSQLLHSEVVKPALQLLSDKAFAGANEEFLRAHDHYRKGRYQECLNECLKAFESTMKAICAKRNWSYDQNDTASKLINVCFANNLVPNFLQSEFAALRTILESGVPTARNKLSGHGRGTQQRKVPDYFASYVLHMTAANILFLVQSEKIYLTL